MPISVNYDKLLLGNEIKLSEKANLYIPKMKEIVEQDTNELLLFSRVFVISVREQFSGVPEKVDEIEAKFPTFWEIAHDESMSREVGEAMFGEGMDIMTMLVAGVAYWTHSEVDDYKLLTNGKIVSEKLDLVVDKDMFLELCKLVTMITDYEPDEDLIAPPGISSKENQCRIFKKLYKGRLRQRQRQKGSSIADRILLLQTLSNTYISFDQIGEMTYYQFLNLLNAYRSLRANNQRFDMYTAYKFDSEKIRLTDLSQDIHASKG